MIKTALGWQSALLLVRKTTSIVAVDITGNTADNGQLNLMDKQVKQELSVDEITVLADRYYNGKDNKIVRKTESP